MGLTVNITPQNYQLSKNPIPLELETDSYITVPGETALMALIASGSNVVGGTMTFIWELGAVTFTVAATPDNSGTQIREKGANTDADYALMVIEDMNKNSLFFETFTLLALSGGVYVGAIWVIANLKGVDFDVYTNFAQVDSGFEKYTVAGHSGGVDEEYAENYKMKAILMVEDIGNPGYYSPVVSKLLAPIDNVCIFDFKAMVNAHLEYDLPAYSQTTPSTCTKNMRIFYVRYSEIYGDPSLEFEVLETTPGYILKAGVPNREFVGNTLMVESRYQTPGNFLTRQPRTKLVTAAQKEFLYFIAPKTSTGYSGVLKLKITISLKNHMADIVVYKSTRTLAQYAVGLFPCGFTQLGLSASASFSAIKSYSICLVDTTGLAVLSEVFTYYPDEDVYIDEQYLFFTNSDGGFDTARFTGVKSTGFEIEKETVQGTDLYNTAVTVSGFKDVNHLITDKFKHASGWITQAQADWLQDLFIAEKKFVIAAGQFVPIIIKTVAHGKYDSQTGKTFYEIEYEYASTNPVIKSMP